MLLMTPVILLPVLSPSSMRALPTEVVLVVSATGLTAPRLRFTPFGFKMVVLPELPLPNWVAPEAVRVEVPLVTNPPFWNVQLTCWPRLVSVSGWSYAAPAVARSTITRMPVPAEGVVALKVRLLAASLASQSTPLLAEPRSILQAGAMAAGLASFSDPPLNFSGPVKLLLPDSLSIPAAIVVPPEPEIAWEYAPP